MDIFFRLTFGESVFKQIPEDYQTHLMEEFPMTWKQVQLPAKGDYVNIRPFVPDHVAAVLDDIQGFILESVKVKRIEWGDVGPNDVYGPCIVFHVKPVKLNLNRLGGLFDDDDDFF
ncbi:hypothetical protein KIH41_02510 [Litoribacter ruber]|uniref:hypothetical protein n=1 Tax=Litoribacter ruber TaxID=702568 RepID=UPI001BDA9A2F|nr:hypothetical protein [Litoribacter ruber]MBT0810152.1 hypothetical protein [Litoribacter ruber]